MCSDEHFLFCRTIFDTVHFMKLSFIYEDFSLKGKSLIEFDIVGVGEY